MMHVLHYHKNPKLQLSGLKYKKKKNFFEEHMELAEWLVRSAPKLVLPVQYPARSSSMMHIIYSYKNPSCNCVA